MPKWKIYNEDAVEWAKHYEKKKFHALLCDPPYHLTTITKRFGKKGSAPAKYGTDGVFARSSAGFMGQTWDGGDVAFDPETWEAFGNVLHPGAFIMAFSSARTWHRLAVAIEDAGFILHPTIFLWSYGSGFPKATRVKGHKEFDGHRYGLQALKPAVEPIIVAQLPYEGKPVDNITQTGAGALNVDGGRIGMDAGWSYPNGRGGSEPHHMQRGERNGIANVPSESTAGRWPANFLLDETAAQKLDEQSGIQKGGFVRNRTNGARPFNNNGKDTGYHTDEEIDEPDGGASRFFYTVSSKLDESDPVYYCAKASRKERNAGLDGFAMRPSPKMEGADRNTRPNANNDVSDRFETSPTPNPHPTVKPIDLSRYLATLLLPPDNYAPRRIFVPFSGVASEMIGCGLAGWEQIVGVEFDKENGYVDIANARLEHWLKEKK